MAVVYDRAITTARRTVGKHQPKRDWRGVVCAAGCEHWPCQSFAAAYALITRNSNTAANR
jgi:hypothetical protein